MKILNMYCSVSGNTAKIAEVISSTASLYHQVTEVEVNSGMTGDEVDFLNFDFLFIGSGVYTWLPPKPMMDFIDKKHKHYNKEKIIQHGSPRRPGRFCVTYATFGGPHTGTNEAEITPKYLGQLPDHLGFEVVAEWLFPGAFIPNAYAVHSTGGRMGDITGRPDKRDLDDVKNLVKGVLTVTEQVKG